MVRTEWLTPLKKECLWPPYKIMAKFNKCLLNKIVPDENWLVYRIKRVFYETDDLMKVREKCKKAESESEIFTEFENDNEKRKRKLVHFDSDDSNSENEKQNEIRYPIPPKKPHEYLSQPEPAASTRADCIDTPTSIYYAGTSSRLSLREINVGKSPNPS